MLAIVLAVGCCMPGPQGAEAPELRNPTVASSGFVAGQQGHTLTITAGEPVAGSVVTGAFRLSAGFPATLDAAQVRGDHLFADGFESSGGTHP